MTVSDPLFPVCGNVALLNPLFENQLPLLRPLFSDWLLLLAWWLLAVEDSSLNGK